MSQLEIFRFLLALIVFVLLAASFTAFIVYTMRVTLKLIKFGAEDKKITKEYIKYGSKKHGCTGCVSNAVYAIVSAAIAVVMIVALAFSLVVQFNEGRVCTNLPLMNVVHSGSMSYVNENNEYAYGKGYTDQMQVYDLIFTHVLPAEKDLKVGDVVVYEVDGAYLVHRIVAIEEPNEFHPDERHFLLQGDANERPDRFPVRYSQMKSIYKGQRIAFVGSFITFMQSPAGWLCVLLVVFAVVATPIAERKLGKAKYARLVEIGVIVEDKPQNNNPTDDDPTDSHADSEAASVDEELEQEPAEEQAQAELASIGAELETEPVEEQAEPDSIAEDVVQEPVEDQDDDEDEEQEENDETVAIEVGRFGSFGEGKTFEQKLDEAQEPLASRYAQISSLLGRIEKVRILRSKKRESYSKGRNAVAKLAIRGKTLNVYLGLDPSDYVDTKYRFVDKTDSKTYAKTPMQLKLTSDRQTKWAKELIADLIAKHGWTLLDEVVAPVSVVEQEPAVDNIVQDEVVATEPAEDIVVDEVAEQVEPDCISENVEQEPVAENDETVAVEVGRFGSFGEGKTFEQKLDEADDVLASRYAQISSLLGRIEKVRILRSKKRESYSKGRNAVAKLAIRGKTLNVYLGLDPADYVDTKYRFVDKTDSKTYAKTPMQLKLTSDRQTKWAKELIADLIAKHGWTLLDEQAQPVSVVEQESVVDVVEQDIAEDIIVDDIAQDEVVEQEPAVDVVQEEVEQEQVVEQDVVADEQAQPDCMASIVEQAEIEEIVEPEQEIVEQNDEEDEIFSQREMELFDEFVKTLTDEEKQSIAEVAKMFEQESFDDCEQAEATVDPVVDVVDEIVEPVEDVVVKEETVEQEIAEPVDSQADSVEKPVEQEETAEPVVEVVEQKPLAAKTVTGSAVFKIKVKRSKKSRKVGDSKKFAD